MKLKLGYPDRIVEIDGRTVHVFKRRLTSAPLVEVVSYYTSGEGILPPVIREIAADIVRALLNTKELRGEILAAIENANRASV